MKWLWIDSRLVDSSKESKNQKECVSPPLVCRQTTVYWWCLMGEFVKRGSQISFTSENVSFHSDFAQHFSVAQQGGFIKNFFFYFGRLFQGFRSPGSAFSSTFFFFFFFLQLASPLSSSWRGKKSWNVISNSFTGKLPCLVYTKVTDVWLPAAVPSTLNGTFTVFSPPQR